MLKEITTELGEILERKNAAYGNSAEDSITFLRLLYPNGIQKNQYGDVLYATRCFDKLKRLATDPDAFGEDAALDLAGYGVLWVRNRRQNRIKEFDQSMVVKENRLEGHPCPKCAKDTREDVGEECWVCFYDRMAFENATDFLEINTHWLDKATTREIEDMAKRGVS